MFLLYKAPCLQNDHNYDYAYILKELGRNNTEFDAEGVVGLLMKSLSKKSVKSMASSQASNRFQTLVGRSLERKRAKEKDLLKGDKYLKKVEEANYIAKTANKHVVLSLGLSYAFEGEYLYEQAEEDLTQFQLWVEVRNYDYGGVYRWSKEKFKSRLILMEDLAELPRL